MKMAKRGPVYFAPKTLDDLKRVVHLAKRTNKCISTVAKRRPASEKEKFSEFAINMKNFNQVVEINMTKKHIVVQASTEIGTIKHFLEKVGLTLCMPDIPDEKSVASVFSSVTHSSDMTLGILSTYVTSIDVLTSSNKIFTYTPEEKPFYAFACGFGSCGIILTLTLKCETSYQMKRTQFGCSFDKLLGNLPFNIKRYPNMSINWFPHTNYAVIYNTEKNLDVKCKSERKYLNRLIPDLNMENYLLNVLYWVCLFFPYLIPFVHYFLFWLIFIWKREKQVSPNKVKHSQSLNNCTTEWVIPIKKTVTALKKIEKWCETGTHFLHFPIRVQFIKKDDIYLSPAYESDVCCISIRIMKPFGFYFPCEKAFSEFGDLIASIGGRPILGQNFNAVNQDLDTLYPQYEDWYKLRNEIDPHNLFVNNLE